MPTVETTRSVHLLSGVLPDLVNATHRINKYHASAGHIAAADADNATALTKIADATTAVNAAIAAHLAND